MKIGIIGAGAYALALAEMFNKRKNNIYIWTKVEKEYKELKENRTNQKALPNFILDENIKVSNTTGFTGIIKYDSDANVSYAIPPGFFS